MALKIFIFAFPRHIVVKEYRNNIHEILTAVRHLEQIPRMLIYACDVDGWVSANSTV